MLYKFQSRSTADVIMLEPNGRQILEVIGKDPSERHGIVTVAQIPGAIAKLEAAIQAQERLGQPPEGDDEGEDHAGEVIELRQRAVPFIDMLKRSEAEGHDVTW